VQALTPAKERMPMASTISHRSAPAMPMELLLALCLIGLVVAARTVPHAPNFTPIVGAALFAGTVFRSRALALGLPVAAMLLSDLVIGFDDWRIRVVIYAALALPVVLGLWGRRFRPIVALLPLALASSLLFFVASNLAVWGFSGMYALDFSGLTQCFVLALPFLHNTVFGDVAWTAALFGSWWLVQLWIPAVRRDLPFIPAQAGIQESQERISP
jgi:hypothetical protein